MTDSNVNASDLHDDAEDSRGFATRQQTPPRLVMLSERRSERTALVDADYGVYSGPIDDSFEPPSTESPSRPAGPFHCHVPRRRESSGARNRLIIVTILCFVFMIIEIVGGLIANSLALITDATHLASDLASFLVSLLAIWLAKKPPSPRMSFGYYRAEIVGALVSVMLIWVITGVLVYLAIQRLLHHHYVIDADTMLITAGLGVGFNIIMAVVLHSGICGCNAIPHGHSHGGGGHSHRSQRHSTSANQRQEEMQSPVSTSSAARSKVTKPTTPKEETNINLRAAMVHVLGDLVQSIGVLIAAYIIKFKPEYKIADPICTFVFSVLVLLTTITVLRDVILAILEAVPRDCDLGAMLGDLEAVEGVRAVHTLNAWALTIGRLAVSVHIAIDSNADWASISRDATLVLREKHHVTHPTVQVEPYEEQIMNACEQCIWTRKLVTSSSPSSPVASQSDC